jgi:hypothetical protein
VTVTGHLDEWSVGPETVETEEEEGAGGGWFGWGGGAVAVPPEMKEGTLAQNRFNYFLIAVDKVFLFFLLFFFSTRLFFYSNFLTPEFFGLNFFDFLLMWFWSFAFLKNEVSTCLVAFFFCQ